MSPSACSASACPVVSPPNIRTSPRAASYTTPGQSRAGGQDADGAGLEGEPETGRARAIVVMSETATTSPARTTALIEWFIVGTPSAPPTQIRRIGSVARVQEPLAGRDAPTHSSAPFVGSGLPSKPTCPSLPRQDRAHVAEGPESQVTGRRANRNPRPMRRGLRVFAGRRVSEGGFDNLGELRRRLQNCPPTAHRGDQADSTHSYRRPCSLLVRVVTIWPR